MTMIGVSGWMFLLVLAHLSCPRQSPESHKMVEVVTANSDYSTETTWTKSYLSVMFANYRSTVSCCDLKQTTVNSLPGWLLSMRLGFPLSFHAEIHHRVLSNCSSGSSAAKYSKKSGDRSRSSAHYQSPCNKQQQQITDILQNMVPSLLDEKNPGLFQPNFRISGAFGHFTAVN